MKEEIDKTKGKTRAGEGRGGKDKMESAVSLRRLLWGSALPALASVTRLHGFQGLRGSRFLRVQREAATSSLSAEGQYSWKN